VNEPNTCTPARSWPGAGLYKSVILGWHWRQLKWAVVTASEAAQGHEANGLPPGSPEFKTLHDEIVAKVLAYSKESGDSVDMLKARLPALCAMERLANSTSTAPRNKAGMAVGIFLVAVLGTIGIGALIGLGAGTAHWIAHLFA